jgi:predicted  nucleic acid-binding Zn-ribbon protein
MKAEAVQQRSLLELADLDAELARIEHRAKNLAEQRHLDDVQSQHREANDRLAALGLALEDLGEHVAKFEAEIDGVRQREERDRALLDSGSVNPKQLTELQHELETLERRQASLEDSLLQVMERREDLQREQADELAGIDTLQTALADARKSRDDALVEIDQVRHQCSAKRAVLAASLAADLVALYERQRAGGGAGAGRLVGQRCGACRIELGRSELSRISAAAEDEVVRCPECGAILLRVTGSDQ